MPDQKQDKEDRRTGAGIEMRHYSIWLSKYSDIQKGILEELQSYRREIENAVKSIPSGELIKPLDRSGRTDCKSMCFVDGGEGITELLGAGMYFIRASGLLLEDTKERKKETFVRDLDMNIIDYDDHTKERVELLRDCMEFDVALRCIEEHKPEYLFLDGSLYVKARKKPIKCIEDSIYRKKFVRLLKACDKNNTNVVGVSEDSRSKLLSNYLSTKYNIKLPKFMTDSSILRLLTGNKSFRTIEFTPHSKFEADAEITERIVTSFPTVYIQVSEYANPLRVDIADWNKPMEEAISLIVELSKGSRYYGYPIPLYLVHMDAKINPRHAEWAANQLSSHIRKNDPRLYDSVLRKNRRGLRPQ
ncbi:MAG: DNA double-strand break repair nuclease NurA [Candidatus Altiarchaeota archaeon]